MPEQAAQALHAPPVIIQGGMGAGVSGWRLAQAVARTGQLGVVSGVALDTLLARRLQLGDPGGHMRRALADFPLPKIAGRILDRYFVPDGIDPGTPFRPIPRIGLRPNQARTELTVAGNFVEVWLAREGHDGLIGINYLEKIQLATPAAAYGAMLAGVDYVLMGAGIPAEIPALLDALAEHRPAEISVTVAGSDDRHTVGIDPRSLWSEAEPAGDEPTGGEPAGDGPGDGASAIDEPVSGEPVSGEPVAGAQVNGKAVNGQAVNGKVKTTRLNGHPLAGHAINGAPVEHSDLAAPPAPTGLTGSTGTTGTTGSTGPTLDQAIDEAMNEAWRLDQANAAARRERARPPRTPEPLKRPRLLAIVSSNVLAMYLARSPATRPDGFILEGPIAGGHSAPPRGKLRLDEDGEPVYGPRDEIDLAKVAALGLPFWLAGGYATPEALASARAAGAAGIQVGTAFALCRESGFEPGLRRRLLAAAVDGTLQVRNAPDASPAGFPFKVAELEGTVADPVPYGERPRLCDLGYLRTPYQKPSGGVGYRCAAEPVDAYVRKGGTAEETTGRRCLCNGLIANIGLAQHRPDGYTEPPLVTLGQDLRFITRLLPAGDHGTADCGVADHGVADHGAVDYGAADVIDYLIGEP